MAVVTFRPHLLSPHARCYAFERYRVHHGAVGVGLLILGAVLIRQPVGHALLAAGVVLVRSDRPDRPWLRDA